MRKIKFLINLKKIGKLRLIEPSKELTESYLHKSDSHLDSAKILLNSNKLEESVSMSYYGMYHSLLALLFKFGIKSENHGASILLLKELFNENKLAEAISYGKKERIDKQYYLDFNITKSDCQDMVKISEEFIINIKNIINHFTDEDIRKIRQDLNNLLRNYDLVDM